MLNISRIAALTLVLALPPYFSLKNEISNKTLYNQIVEHFFPKSFLNPLIVMNDYLCYAEGDKKCCSCQTYCTFYQTCCIDTFFSNNITSVKEYIEIFRERNEARNYVKMLSPTNADIPFSVRNISMVALCGNNDSRYCESCNQNYSKYDIPVSADGVMYRNKDCAICHGITKYSYVTYELSECRTEINGNVIPDKTCYLTIVNASYQHIITRTPSFANCSYYEKMLCTESYFALIFDIFKTYYKNPFCAKCNGALDLDNYLCVSVFNNLLPPPPPAFRMLISFNDFRESGTKLTIGKSICDCGFYYDIFNGKCKVRHESVPCTNNRFTSLPSGNLTSPIDPTLPTSRGPQSPPPPMPPSPPAPPAPPSPTLPSTYGPGFSSSPAPPPFLPNLKDILIYDCIQKYNGSIIFKINNSGKFNPDKHFIESYIKVQNTVYVRANYLGVLPDSFLMGIAVSVYFSPIQNIPYTKLYGFSLERHFINERVCVDSEIIEDDFQLTSDCNFKSNGKVYNVAEDSTYWNEIKGNKRKYGAAHCKRFHLISTCPLDMLYGILNMSFIAIENGLIETMINKKQKVYFPEQYLPTAEGIGICFRISPKASKIHAWSTTLTNIEKKLSVCFLFLSILLEIITLLTYLLFRELRTIPGKNLMALVVALIGCDIIILALFFTKAINENLCSIIAVLLHFQSLSVSTWSIVIAFDLWITFSHTFRVERSKTVLMNYNIIGWGLPAAFVLVCLTVDIVVRGETPLIGYGGSEHCWITSVYARLIVYIGPFSLITLTSFLIVSLVMIKLKQSYKSTARMINKKQPINYTKMAMKLCLVLGASELIGLIQVPKQNVNSETLKAFNESLGLLYNVVRTLRGTFIFFIFICNKQVLDKFKAMLCRIHSCNHKVDDNTTRSHKVMESKMDWKMSETRL